MGATWKRICAYVVTLAMLVGVLPHMSITAKADGEATVYCIYAVLVEGQDPAELELVAPGGDIPEGKGIFVKYVTGGTYTTVSGDENYELLANNANVTIGAGAVPMYMALAGTSSLVNGNMTASSAADDFPAYTGAMDAVAILNYFHSGTYEGDGSKAYNYTVTGNNAYAGWLEANNLTVETGCTFDIVSAEGFGTGVVIRGTATVNGTINIADRDGDSNQLIVLEGATLAFADGAALTTNGNGVLDVKGGATVTGLTLYDAFDESTENFPTFTCDGTTNENEECFSYDAEAGKWVRNTGSGFGGEWSYGTNPALNICVNDPERGTVSFSVNGGTTYTAGDEAIGTALDTVSMTTGTTLKVNLSPSEGNVVDNFELWVNGNNLLSAGDARDAAIAAAMGESGYSVTLETNGPVDIIANFRGDDGGGTPGGGDPGDPGDPGDGGADLAINASGASATYQFAGDASATPVPDDGHVSFEGKESAASVTIVFSGKTINGVQVNYNDGTDHENFLRISDNTYTFTKTGDDWPDMEIRAIDYDTLYDNEYQCFIVGGNESTAVTIGGQSYTDGTVKTFTTGTPILLSVNAAPYKVVASRYSGESRNTEVTKEGGVYTYTPSKDTPFEFKVYMTADDEAYDNLTEDWETEKSVEFQVRDGNAANYVTPKVNGSAVSASKMAKANERVKLVIGKTVNTVTLEITADEEHTYEVFLNGSDVTSQVSSNVYTWDVTGEHSPEIRFRVEGEDPMDPGDGGDKSEDYEGAKAAVEAANIAYYVADPTANKDTLTTYLKKHLWITIFGENPNDHHQADYNGMFDDETAMNATVSMGALNTSDGAVPNKAGTGKLPYYTFTMDIHEGVTATGKIYVLENPYDVVAKFTKNGNVTYQTKQCDTFAMEGSVIFVGAYDTITDDRGDKNPCVEFFGNCAEPVGTWDSGNPEYLFAGHITEEHIPISRGDYDISCSMITLNTSCTSVKISGNGATTGNGTSAAWGWSNLSLYATNGTTAANPKEFDVYVGDTEITVDSVDAAAGMTITSIDCTLANAAKAVTVTESSGTFTVKPLSNFYNVIPLTITYADGSKAYIKINRVALALGESGKMEGTSRVAIHHGTDCQKDYTVSGFDTVYGCFYYPNNKTAEANGRVNLEVTYTWADGSVTRKTVTPINTSIITDANQGTTHVDDFILWNGAESARPVRVQATAVVSGSTDDTFKGALIGAGAGVTWSK